MKDLCLPEPEVGDYLAFRNMGAYTLCCAVEFNGFPLAEFIYVASKSWKFITKELVIEKIKTCFQSF